MTSKQYHNRLSWSYLMTAAIFAVMAFSFLLFVPLAVMEKSATWALALGWLSLVSIFRARVNLTKSMEHKKRSH